METSLQNLCFPCSPAQPVCFPRSDVTLFLAHPCEVFTTRHEFLHGSVFTCLLEECGSADCELPTPCCPCPCQCGRSLSHLRCTCLLSLEPGPALVHLMPFSPLPHFGVFFFVFFLLRSEGKGEEEEGFLRHPRFLPLTFTLVWARGDSAHFHPLFSRLLLFVAARVFGSSAAFEPAMCTDLVA